MNEIRFEELLNGSEPSMQDLAGFISVAEKLPSDLLWKVVSDYPNMQWMLKKAALSKLQAKVPKENIDNALDAIVTRLAQK